MDHSAIVKDYVAGGIAGIAGLVVGFPFDTTKVQIQIQPRCTQYRNAREAVVNINHLGLSHGFFRGLSLPLFSYGFVNAVFFGAYSHTFQALKLHSYPYYMSVFISGCAGAAVQLIPAVPSEVVKVVLQSQIPRMVLNSGLGIKPVEFHGPLQTARVIMRSRGLKGLYRGLSIQAIRDVPSGGVYFLTYVRLDEAMAAHLPSVSHFLVDVIAGGMAGMISWFVVNPFDVVKSKMQADYNGQLYRNMWHCAISSYRDGGMEIFFRGALVNAIRAFPVNAAIFVAYRYSIRGLNALHHRPADFDED